jgi:hypothetical protein
MKRRTAGLTAPLASGHAGANLELVTHEYPGRVEHELALQSLEAKSA